MSRWERVKVNCKGKPGTRYEQKRKGLKVRRKWKERGEKIGSRKKKKEKREGRTAKRSSKDAPKLVDCLLTVTSVCVEGIDTSLMQTGRTIGVTW
jgi:hypothetical protein